MGQGQEKVADSAMKKLSKAGGWLLLQNVHLMPDWLPTLEDRLQTLTPHADFRFFITSEPPPPSPHSQSQPRNLPEGILRTCYRIANEPPSDLKSNMRKCWNVFTPDVFESSGRPMSSRRVCLGCVSFIRVCSDGRVYGCQVSSVERE